MIVADLGAGTGFYSVVAAEMVPKGKVYAIEIQKDFLTTIRNKIKEKNLDNLECFWGNIEKIEGTKLGNEIADAVIASNVLFQVDNKEKFMEEMKRILKPEGRVLLVDWSDNSPIYSDLKKIISKNRAQEIFENKGFTFDKEIDAGAHHYGMIFKKGEKP